MWRFLLFTALAAFAADLNDDLFDAARKGDLAGVKALVGKGAAVDARNRYEATPLLYAAMNGHTEVVRFLLDKGAGPNVKDTFYNWVPITQAAARGHAEVVKLLLEKGADSTEAMRNAIMGGRVEVARAVLQTAKFTPEALANFLAFAEKQKRTDIADLLKVGAKQ